MTPESAVTLVLGILLITVLPISVALWFVYRSQSRRIRAMQAQFPQALRVEAANFYGQESSGATQMRGNGVLVLLPDRLVFERLMPRREYSVPRDRIVRIETPSSFLGKTNFRPLLKVVFHDEAGQLDSMAWLVEDVAAWSTLLTPEVVSVAA